MKSIAHGFALLLVLLVSSSRFANCGVFCARSKERLVLEAVANEIITTTACPKLLDPAKYVARLDLSYIYSLDVAESSESDQSGTVVEQQEQLLQSIERAIATSVASTLHQCNAQEQPVYAVQISSDDGTSPNLQKHVILPFSNSSNFNASCPSVSTSSTQENSFNNISVLSQCLIVRGMTSILFEESGANQNVSAIDSLVYTLIEATLGNVHFLNQFVATQPLLKTLQLTFSKYVQSTGGNFILLPRQSKGSNSGSFKIAIVAALLVVGLIATALLLIILFRQRKSHRDRNRSDSKEVSERNGIVAKKRRRRDPFSFEALEDICSTNDQDESLPSGWMIVTNNNNDVPSTSDIEAPPQGANASRAVTTTWSDLTSDSESIMSSLHLDRIDEEVGECSYEQDDNASVNDDFGNPMNRFTGQNDNENVEVSLSNSLWDDEIGSWPSSILPFSSSHQHLNPGNDIFDAIVNRHGMVEPNCDTELNIEVSLDKEIMISSTSHLNNRTIEVEEKELDHGNTSQTFTFSSDSDTNLTSSEAFVEPLHRENSRIRTPITEHFYDDEDFQSIEMCVVWMDDDKGDSNEERLSADNSGGTSFPAPSSPDVLLSCEFANDENNGSTVYDSLLQEQSLATVSVESSLVSKKVPFSISQRLIPPESDLTDANNLLKSTLGTESTWSNAYTFSSSDAYRSDLEVKSNPTPTGQHPKEPGDGNSHAFIAHWAREVMIRLMSDSPKMLRCGTEMEFNSKDSESSC